MTFSNIRLDDRVVQAVREAVDIVDIAGQMTTLKRAGKRYQGLCPFHKEKTPSFGVDPDQGLYYCFGCGAGGDGIKLYQEQTGDDFPAAIEALARRYGIPLPQAPATGPSARRQRDVREALDAAAQLFQKALSKSTFARRYLDERKISSELCQRFGLGYAPDEWRFLLEALRRRFPIDDLIATGLVGKSQRSGEPYDRFRHRLMFPIHGPSGQLVGFGGRTLGDDRAKYINTSETDYFQKKTLLYGFHLAKRAMRDGGTALLVEGYLDVMAASACGIPYAVASMGTSLTAEQARLLARYCDEVVVGYDGDEAGQKAYRKALPILLAAGLGVRRARIPAGEDPDSLYRKEGADAVVAVVEAAVDGIEAELEKLTSHLDIDPRERAKKAESLVELLRLLRNRNTRNAYARLAAERLGLKEDILQHQVNVAARTVSSARSSPPGVRLRSSGPRPGGPAAAPDVAREIPSASSQDKALADSEPLASGIRTEEEKALALLLHRGHTAPPIEDLPPVEVFFDVECRNIYSAFCALYRGGEQRAPAGSDVVAKLSREGGTIDRAARLLLEESDCPEGSLRTSLDRLVRRWRQQRGSVLTREIQQAERQGDQARLAQLLEEKKSLSRSLHPEMTGKLW